MNDIILFPIINQLFFAIVTLFLWRYSRWQKAISVVGNVIGFVIANVFLLTVWDEGILTYNAENWAAPLGITFVGDMLAATLILLTSICGMAVSMYSAGSMDRDRLSFGYYPIFHFLLLGLNGAFLTGDVFNLYVWFEMIIISSFVMITLGGEKRQLEGAIKYFTLNVFASVIFLTAIAVLYGLTGSLNMADLSLKVAQIENKGLVEITGLLFLIGFGIKAAVFPMYFWLPASYHTPPAAISAIFGGLLTKLGVYALVRTFTLIFFDIEFLNTVILVLGGLTLFSGALGALIQNNITKMFSYLIICHIGYMIIGLGLHTELAIAGVVFYLIHDIIVKSNMFMISGLIYKLKGTYSMRDLGGMYAKHPLLSLIMAISFFSLVGIPPLSGFWPKIAFISESLKTKGGGWLIAAILFGTFMTLYIIARMWAQVFWKARPEVKIRESFLYFKDHRLLHKIEMIVPIVGLTIITLMIGFGAEKVQQLALVVSDQLINKQHYINAVLGK